VKGSFLIGQRTLKTALGSGLSLFIAQSLHLQNFSTAAVITLLSIQNTKKQSFSIAVQRFIASIIAMLIGWFLFEELNYSPITVVIYFLLTIPLLVKLKLREGVVPSSVIVLQIYVTGNVTFTYFLNEIAILAIGITIALIVNSYMPSIEETMIKTKDQIEQNFKMILFFIALYMKEKEQSPPQKIARETAELINKAKTLAFTEVENSYFKANPYYINYFEMREKQFEIIQDKILPLLQRIDCSFPQAYMVATFFEDTGVYLNEKSTGEELIRKLEEMKEEFETMPLPVSRHEFETRANLLMIVNDLENLLTIKAEFSKKITFL
jgi:uncharacterized membrane protein YgaE (UPF0421/DUF939 family)